MANGFSSMMSTSISSLLATASQHYQQKQYGPALVVCDRALQMCGTRPGNTSDLLSVRDVRVQVLGKQGRLPAAIEEAKLMIRADKSDGRGYVRCCQIAKAQGNYWQALRWVRQALSRVSTSDCLRERLSREERTLQDTIASDIINTNPTDPLTVLPEEIVTDVLKNIQHKQLIRCLRVSKSWKYTLERLSPLSDTMELPFESLFIISRRSMSAALNRIKNSPKVLCCGDVDKRAATLLCANLEQWQNWSSLSKIIIHYWSEDYLPTDRLSNLPFHRYSLKELSLEGTIDPGRVYAILSSCQLLRRAEFKDVKPPSGPHRSQYKLNNDPPLPPLPHLQHLKVIAIADDPYDEGADEWRMTMAQFLVCQINALLSDTDFAEGTKSHIDIDA